MKKSRIFVVLIFLLLALVFSACDSAVSSEEPQEETSEEVSSATAEQYAEFKPYLDLMYSTFDYFGVSEDPSYSFGVASREIVSKSDGTVTITTEYDDGTTTVETATRTTVTASDGSETVTTTYSDGTTYTETTKTNSDGSTVFTKEYPSGSIVEVTTTTATDGSSGAYKTTYTNVTSYPDDYYTLMEWSDDGSTFTSTTTDSCGCTYVCSEESASGSDSLKITFELKNHEFTYETASGESYAGKDIRGSFAVEEEHKYSNGVTTGSISFTVSDFAMTCGGKEIAADLEINFSYSYEDADPDTILNSSFSGSATFKIDGTAYALTEEQIKDILGW